MNFEIALQEAQKVYSVLAAGGVVIGPIYEGYGIFAASDAAVDRIFRAKRRGDHKLFTLLGNRALQKEIHSVSPAASKLIDAVTVDYDMALGVVAKTNLDHPYLQRAARGVLERTVREGKVNILLNSGVLVEHLALICLQEQLPVFGTSANLTGRGLKSRVSDIEQPVREAADYILDIGSLAGYASSIVDLETPTTLRFGYKYELVRRIAVVECGLDLPDFPTNTDD
jgi:tRNA A37 threonylcarbamoyladenosine synthetase subunit TsaC/SUA5/YrdC